MGKKNIFCILFEFPPINSAGVFRPLRFVNSLAESGYNVTVLTVKIDSNFLDTLPRIDNSLLNLVNEKINIIRIPIDKIEKPRNQFKSFYNIWKNSSGDKFFNLISDKNKTKIEQLIINLSTEIIFVSAPPFSLTIFGSYLSKKFSIPLVLDMRDAWLGWSMVPFPSYDYYLRRKILERKVLNQASVIISVTPELIKKFIRDNPKIPHSKFKLIYNSPNKKLEIKDTFIFEGLMYKENIHIGYSGSFYYVPKLTFFEKIKKPHRFLQYHRKEDDWKYRSPYYFFKAFKIFLDQNLHIRQKVFFNYIGQAENWLKQMVCDFGIQSNVIFHGIQSYNKVLDLENEFDLLLVTSEKTKKSNHYCLPSKLFNYVNSSKPILAFITDGPQKKFITKTNCGIVFDPDDTLEAVSTLEQTIFNGCSLKINKENFEEYNFENTKKLFLNLMRELN